MFKQLLSLIFRYAVRDLKIEDGYYSTMSISKAEIIFTSVLILAGSAVFLGLTQKPGFGVEDRGDWREVNGDNISVTSKVWINNPSKLTVNYTDVKLQYRMLMNGVILVEGERNRIRVEKGNQTKEINSTLMQDKIPYWWASHVRNNETSQLQVPLSVKAGLGPATVPFHAVVYQDEIETDLIGVINNGINQAEGTYSYGEEIAGYSTGPEIEIVNGSAEWGQVSTSKTNLQLDLDVRNPNSYPLPVPGTAGNVEMNDVDMLEWSNDEARIIQSPENNVIAPGETEELTFQIEMDNSEIDNWLTSHVRSGEQTEGSLNMKLLFELQGQQITLPPGDGLQCGFSFQTNILEDQNSTSSFEECQLDRGQRDSLESDSGKETRDEGLVDDTVGGFIG